MVTFEVESEAFAQGILNHVQLIQFAESLGGTETLITYPITQTHADVPPELLARNGITTSVLRLSVGIEGIKDLIVREQVKLFFLCNPHNPVGRVWTREELETLGDICHRHHVIVVSDEIHADYTFQGTHHIFAGLKPEYEEITVTCTAPTKTFNIAGLQISNILIPNRELRHKFRGRVNAAGYQRINVACPRSVLTQALEQLEKAVHTR